MEGLGPVGVRAAHIAHGDAQGGNRVYLLAGLASTQIFNQADGAFLQTIRTFRPMTAAEAANIHPNRVDLYTVRAGDTWASIAERSGGAVDAQTLAVMNSTQSGAQPAPGARVKIVVGG
jgi:predicted Zn-dependent protease